MIGFCGFARTGKNAAATELSKLLPEKTFKEFAFAAAIKEDLAPCTEWCRKFGADISSDTFKEQFRPMYVLWSKVAKVITDNEQVWIDRIKYDLLYYHDIGHIPLITDVRYKYEIDFILKHKGIVLYIDRPDYLPKNDEEEDSFKVIESHYKDYIKEHTVYNDSSKENLGKNCLTILQKHGYF